MYTVIIAEDEQIECTALVHKIEKLTPQLEVVSTVNDGMSLLHEVEHYHPDIAIVDINMPGLNGLDAIELLRARKMDLKIIINTSYSDFEYIQKALQLGATDYLLKPGSSQMLKNALEKIITQLYEEYKDRMEKEQHEMLVGDLKEVVKEKWMISLLLGSQDKKCLNLLQQNMPLLDNGGYFYAWKTVRTAENHVGNLYMEMVCRQIEEKLNEFCTNISCIYKDVFYSFLVVSSEKMKTQEQLERILEYICRKLRSEGISLKVGCSRFHVLAEEYHMGIYEAQAALQTYGEEIVTFFHYDVKNEKQKYVFEDAARQIFETWQKNPQGLENCLRTWICGQEFQELTSLEAMHSQITVFLSELYTRLESAREYGSALFISPVPWKEVRDSHGPEDFVRCIMDYLRKISKQLDMKSKSNSYVNHAMVYIFEHYNREITLENAANAIAISPFYLSRLFKQELNTTFVEILTNIRICQAVRLLRETGLTGAEIAQEVGYASGTYFYRVFKKTVGITFGDLRKLV